MVPDDIDRWLRTPWLAGVAGSFVAVRFAPGTSWGERVFNVMCGALCAAYITPAIADRLEVVKAPQQSAIAFVVGLFAMTLAAAIVQGIRETNVAEIIRGWLSRSKPKE